MNIYTSLFQDIQEILLIVNVHGIVADLNRKATQLLDYNFLDTNERHIKTFINQAFDNNIDNTFDVLWNKFTNNDNKAENCKEIFLAGKNGNPSVTLSKLIDKQIDECYIIKLSVIKSENESKNLPNTFGRGFTDEVLDGYFLMKLKYPYDVTELSETKLEFLEDNLEITEANEKILKQYLVNEKEFIGKKYKDFFSHDFEYGRKILKQVIKYEKILLETDERKSDGTKMIVEGYYVCLYNNEGKLTGIEGHQRDLSSIRQEQLNLIENEKNFRSFFDTLDDFLFVLDTEGKIIKVNNYVKQKLNYTDEELQGKSLLKLHPENRKKEAESIFRMMLCNPNVMCTIPLVTSTNDIIPVETKISRGLWNNKPVIFGISKNLTDLKLSEEKFLKVFHLNPAICFITEFETGKFIDVNDTFAAQLEYDRNDVIGKTINDLNLFDYDTRTYTTIKMMQNNRLFNYETIVRTKTGGKRSVIISSEFIILHEKRYLYSVALDVTENKDTQASLKSSREIFDHFMEYLPAAAFIKDINYKTLFVNKRMIELFGAKAWIGRTTLDVFPSEIAEVMMEKDRITFEKGFETYEETIPDINGNYRTYQTHKFVFRDKNNDKIMGGIALDITQLKQIEKELQKEKEKAQESDRLKTAFLANMSHEIRTPMNGIIGFAELLTDPDLSNDKRMAYKEVIENSCNQLLSIINAIIDISKIETNQVSVYNTEINLNSFLVRIFSFFTPNAAQNNLHFYIKQGLNDKFCDIIADETKLNQILTNLISNALKFTHEGYVEFGYTLNNNFLEFYVKDTGIGIAKENQEIIFDRFRQVETTYSRKYDGTGLGLAISKAYVEIMGGKIWLESNQAHGSVFYFTIPFEPVNKDIFKELVNNDNQSQEKKIKILVAEDEETNFLLFEATLLPRNVELFHAKNGVDAIQMCKSLPELDMIFLDIRMPLINGIDAFEEIKHIHANVPIIANTAYALAGDKEKYLAMGFSDYLAKPAKKTDILAIVRKYFPENIA